MKEIWFYVDNFVFRKKKAWKSSLIVFILVDFDDGNRFSTLMSHSYDDSRS